MLQQFTAIVWQEEEWFVAQYLQVDVASQGKSETEAVENLREALELYFSRWAYCAGLAMTITRWVLLL